MKKKFFVITIIAIAMSAFSLLFVGCAQRSSENAKPSETVKLDTPLLSIDGNVLSWNNVSHAAGYSVRVDDGEAVRLDYSETSFTLSGGTVGSFIVRCKAIAESESGYVDSDEAEINYVVSPSELLLASNPDKLVYYLDEKISVLDTGGLKVKVKLNNDTLQDVEPTEISEVDLTTVGEKTVTVYYKAAGAETPLATSFLVEVKRRSEEDIQSLKTVIKEYDQTDPNIVIADGDVTAIDMDGNAVTIQKNDAGKSYVSLSGASSLILKVTDAGGAYRL